MGNNTPKTDYKGIEIKNWFVMNISTNKNNVTVGDNLILKYSFVLNDKTTKYDSSLLPYFETIIKTNTGFSKTINGKYSKNITIPVNTVGKLIITANTDNEMKTIIITANEKPIPPVPPVVNNTTNNIITANEKPIPPVPPVVNNTTNNNKTNNITEATATMKNTGIPLVILLISLLVSIATMKEKNS